MQLQCWLYQASAQNTKKLVWAVLLKVSLDATTRVFFLTELHFTAFHCIETRTGHFKGMESNQYAMTKQKKNSLSEMYNDYQKSRRKRKTKEMFSADSSVSGLIVLLGCVTLVSYWFGSSCGSTASRQIRELWTGQCCKQALALALAERGAQYQLTV